MIDIKTSLAEKTYKNLLEAVKDNNWTCERHDDELKINYGVNGDFMHMNFRILVDKDTDTVRLFSYLPVQFDESKRTQGALVTSAANYSLSDGRFEYDVKDGSVFFKMTASYRMSIISVEALVYMLNYSAWAVDKFQSDFAKVNGGSLSVSEFAKKYNK
ncbi:MAG: YbjN domain-containing protein [Roseburia sp.]|nr:YbjN domain-containing protein [Roseburia sp.]